MLATGHQKLTTGNWQLATSNWQLPMRLSIKIGALCAVVAVLPLIIASAIILPRISSHTHEKAAEQLRTEARAAAALYD
jgi:hypothetical protein